MTSKLVKEIGKAASADLVSTLLQALVLAMAVAMANGLEPGETQVWRQANATVPAAFAGAEVGMVVVNRVGLTFYSLLTLVGGVAAYEWNWKLRYARAGNRTSARVSFWILVNALSCLMTQISNAIMLDTAFATQARLVQCHWHQRLAAAGYIGAMGAQFMVLLVRAELTLDTQNRWACLVFKVTRLMTVLGMPLTGVVAIATFHGAIFYARTCTQELVLWLVWVFTVCALGLSSCFLLMFILPVYRHAKSRRTSNAEGRAAAQRLLKTARHNLRLSLVQIASTLLFQATGVYLQSAFRDDTGRPELSYLRLVNFMGYISDLIVNTSALLLMSSAWQPAALYRLLNERQTRYAASTLLPKSGALRDGAGRIMSAAGPSIRSTAPRISTQATSVVAPDDQVQEQGQVVAC